MLATTSLKLDLDLKVRLQHLAEKRRRSANWLMGEAIRDYLAREEAREEAREQALAAWAAYQETGRHVTQEEADQWLARLEDGEIVPSPECHT